MKPQTALPPVVLVLTLAAGCAPRGKSGGASADPGGAAAAVDSAGDSAGPARQGPAYSQGACPALVEGSNRFPTGEATYDVTLDLPADPQGAAVVFVWHWLGGSAAQAARAMQLEDVRGDDKVIFVVPDSSGHQYEWRFTAQPEGNPDLLLFDDLLSCLWQQYDVDLDRVGATGMSAGGLWTSYLTLHRAEWLSATAPLSGGTFPGGYETPASPIPVLLTWGGPRDTYSTLSFDDTTRDMLDRLRADGHFVVACEHDRGHTLPPGGIGYAYQFLMDHPRGVSPEPYAAGLPAGFPAWCAQPSAR
jgi:predicted esterase